MQYKEGMLKEGSLEGKVYIVTGGGSGLGKSMTKYLLELGSSVVITSRNLKKLESCAKELSSGIKGKVLPLACDVRDPEQVDKVILNSYEEFQKIDGLVNNAAGNFISPTERLSPNGFNSIIDIVLKGTCFFTLALGKKWIEKKESGNIVNIVTTYALTGSGYVSPSAAAKGGVTSFTRSIASEWVKYNIRCNAIAPGPFPTKGAWDRLFPKPFSALFDMKKKLPMKRYGDHQELANLAAYLISDFSSYINGEIITIDGGEWTYKAGQFNMLDKVPKKLWGVVEKMTRKAKK